MQYQSPVRQRNGGSGHRIILDRGYVNLGISEYQFMPLIAHTVSLVHPAESWLLLCLARNRLSLNLNLLRLLIFHGWSRELVYFL